MAKAQSNSSPQEVEIKFKVDDLKALAKKLCSTGFKIKTKRTHEFNILFDFPDSKLRKRGEVLRIREYGKSWTVTCKGKGKAGPHKTRTELETEVSDGQQLAAIFEAIGLKPSFRYEKFRTEWTDGKGAVVVDETPIGNIAEIEGKAAWIDRTAKQLGISKAEYSTKSYIELFFEWKSTHKNSAREMTWDEIKTSKQQH
ncbi:MAG: adenylate cyclase [Candidatus Angelobacter sp.]|nr:adenylate cyclase [Candidatus Angelobacter sp.]